MKVIRPTGIDLLCKVNDGYFICNNCGAIMDFNYDTDILTCPGCGDTILKSDYEYEGYDKLSNRYSKYLGEIPIGCQACGGPYPQCKTSCKLFDD